jgi:hypothetical protein
LNVPNRIQLNEGRHKVLRLSQGTTIQLSDLQPGTSILPAVQIAKVGSYHHPAYGDFKITQQTFAEIIKNFSTNVYGQKIFVDINHKPGEGAAAEVRRLWVDGDWLMGEMEITPYGEESIRTKRFIYLSIDYTDSWDHPETRKNHGAVMFGAGLTTRPFIKGQAGIELAEPSETLRQNNNMKLFLEKLREYLGHKKAGTKLSDAVVGYFEAEAKKLGEAPSDESLTVLLDSVKQVADAAIETARKELADANDKPIHLSVNAGMTLTEVENLLAAREAKRLQDEQSKAKKLADNCTAFEKAIDTAPGLSEATVKTLKEAKSLITADMTEAQVKALAEHQIALGNKLEATRKLSDIGFNFSGTTRISVDESNNIKSLAETVRQGLRSTSAYANQRLTLAEKSVNQLFVDKVLADFDHRYANALQREYRILSGADTHIGSAFLPVSYQREVIREALADLNILTLVRTHVDPTATATTEIPFEIRTSSAGIPNEGIVFEGQGIPSAGVGTDHVLAYINAMKLALKVTNEIIHFSTNSGINWNAWGENIASNARIMRELIHIRVANEMLRASDSYNAVAVNNENFNATDNGLIKTATFPVVRPYQARDLKGNAIGNPECPVVITVNGSPVKYFTGEANLAAGLYWRFANLNLGYIQVVDQTGAIAGANATGTINYYRPTNLIKFDLKLPEGVPEYKKHLNSLIDAIGDQKAMLSSQRYVRPDYALMSAMLNNEITKADQFIISLKRDGSNTTAQGDLEAIKSLPAFDCNAPGLDIADQRVLIGQRGLTSYTVAKPYNVGLPFEAVDRDGRPTGEKIAYGEEYNSIYTPAPVRNRYTSVLVYDSEQR